MPASCPRDLDQLADTLEECTTFGRVRPDQKRAMVHALQSRGHTVAMTGDGVNDVLALKDADIGVAMGAGSAASRAVAQIVLLDNKFATLPHVVGEGRRVIGNIERVSNLFLTKTVYSVLLAVLVGIAGLASKIFGSDPLLFPFQPIHVTIAAWFTIGIPAFVLSLAPNSERAHPGFVRRVMTSALPSGLVVGVATFVSYLAAYQGREATAQQQTQASTAALITLLVTAVWVLAVVARPYEWWRVALVAVSALAYVVIFSIPLAQKTFMLDPSNLAVTSIALVIGLVGAAVIEVSWWVQGAVIGERRQAVAKAAACRVTPMGFLDKAKSLRLEERRQGGHGDRQGRRHRRPEDPGQVRRPGRQGAGRRQEGRRQDGSADTLTYGQTFGLR